ncbi:unnamed protein product [Arctogadus glacialis]
MQWPTALTETCGAGTISEAWDYSTGGAGFGGAPLFCALSRPFFVLWLLSPSYWKYKLERLEIPKKIR